MSESRLRRLLHALTRQTEGGADDASPQVRDDLREVDSWRVRMEGGGLLDRLLTTRGPDRVGAVGEVVHLLPPLDRVARMRAKWWRVRVGDEVVLDRRLRSSDDGVVMYRSLVPGRWPVVAELLDGEGRRLHAEPVQPPLLQVIGDAPTFAIDAQVAVSRPSAMPVLRGLREAGCELFYFDLEDADRSLELRRALSEAGAPPAAILLHAKDTAEVRTLGVDFRAVFLTATLRRLRGSGVAVVAVVSSSEAAAEAAARAGVDAYEELNPARRAAAGYLERSVSLPRTTEARLDRMTRSRVVAGNACEVELDNRRARQRMFEAIEAARERVHLQYYMIQDGPFSDQLGARLIRASRRGVEVRLLVDALYSVDGVAGASNAVARGLMAIPAIDVVAAAPIASRDDLEPRILKHRDHRKLVVIDGELAFVGGRNASDEYFTGFDEVAITDWTPHGRIPWLDAHVEVRGPLVADIERAFVARWAEAGGRPPPGGEVRIQTPPAAGRSSARLVLHDGIDDAAAMLSYEALIDGARQHIWIVNDFPIVPSLQLALRRALHRGVELRVLTGCAIPRRRDGSFFDGPLHRQAFEYMTKKRLEPLMNAGAEVWEYVVPPQPLIVCRGDMVRPYVHAKIVTVDGALCSVGSANLDATASYWEREANVIVQDPDLTRRLEARLQHMCGQGRRVDPSSEQWRSEGVLRELASQLWPESLYA
ncbi:MAG: phosphatidylserine/phosphatidylglycerophosphate/cardiolipin synthase family protein [Nannocystaceae bacterium]